MTEWEQQGYDAWIELWLKYECEPRASLCPARYMSDADKRSAYLRGWRRAKKEYND